MSDHAPVDTAWKIHGALADWTAKADAKASFALTIESAIVAGIITLRGTGHHLAGLHGRWQLTLFWSGLTSLGLAVLLAVSAVLPSLRSPKMGNEWQENFIFFGHVRHWEAGQLEHALASRDVLPVLSRQLVVMAEIAWSKHRKVQRSMFLGLIGALAVCVVYFFK